MNGDKQFKGTGKTYTIANHILQLTIAFVHEIVAFVHEIVTFVH